MTSNMSSVEPWPRLSLREWVDTKDTLHLWTQIVGKIRLALAPHVNHWWNVTLYVTARGLTTSAMPCRGAFLVGQLRPLVHALFRPAGAATSRRCSELSGLRHAGCVFTRVHQRRLVARWRRGR